MLHNCIITLYFFINFHPYHKGIVANMHIYKGMLVLIDDLQCTLSMTCIVLYDPGSRRLFKVSGIIVVFDLHNNDNSRGPQIAENNFLCFYLHF